jgi:serine/threonine protein kinase
MQHNVLIDHQCTPQLADFGLARLGDSFTSMTHANTPGWTSPQRLGGETHESSDDVYSFGCLCYYVSK